MVSEREFQITCPCPCSAMQPRIKHTSKRGEGVANSGKKGKKKEMTRARKPVAKEKSGKKGGGRRPQTSSTSLHSDGGSRSSRSDGGSRSSHNDSNTSLRRVPLRERVEVAQASRESGVEPRHSRKKSQVEGRVRRRRIEGMTVSSGLVGEEEEEEGEATKKREKRGKKVRVADTSVAKWKPVSMAARKLLSDGMVSALGYMRYT